MNEKHGIFQQFFQRSGIDSIVYGKISSRKKLSQKRESEYTFAHRLTCYG